jgi:methylenetetrahydrofolate reductase (NADPH)
VAVVTDLESLAILECFPGLVVDPVVRDRVMTAADTREAGIEVAVDQARAMLGIAGVVGVNLSGSATSGPESESAAIMSEVATRLRSA